MQNFTVRFIARLMREISCSVSSEVYSVIIVQNLCEIILIITKAYKVCVKFSFLTGTLTPPS